jgi:hypothetical protein
MRARSAQRAIGNPRWCGGGMKKRDGVLWWGPRAKRAGAKGQPMLGLACCGVVAPSFLGGWHTHYPYGPARAVKEVQGGAGDPGRMTSVAGLGGGGGLDGGGGRAKAVEEGQDGSDASSLFAFMGLISNEAPYDTRSRQSACEWGPCQVANRQRPAPLRVPWSYASWSYPTAAPGTATVCIVHR